MKKLASIMVICLMAISAFGQSKSEVEITGTQLDEMKKSVSMVHQKLKTLSANFVQEKESSLFTEKVTQKGKFCYQAPMQLRWEYTSPKAMILIFNKEGMTIKSGEEISKKNDKMIGEVESMIISILDGKNFNNEKDFTINYYFDKKTNHPIVQLIPKNKKIKASFKKIRIVLNNKNHLADQVILEEASGDVTTITFSDKKINGELPEDCFTVK